MNFMPLTREQLEAMPLSAYLERQRSLARVVDALRLDHYARYHGPFAARLGEWVRNRAALSDAITCTDPHCQGLALSGTGLCAQHLHKERAA